MTEVVTGLKTHLEISTSMFLWGNENSTETTSFLYVFIPAIHVFLLLTQTRTTTAHAVLYMKITADNGILKLSLSARKSNRGY